MNYPAYFHTKNKYRFLFQADISVNQNGLSDVFNPFVVGRKNWLFAGSPAGAHASATFFTLIETAKANGIEPYAYLRYLLARLPLVRDEQGLRELLPQNIDQNQIQR